jgi:hypothetical protein
MDACYAMSGASAYMSVLEPSEMPSRDEAAQVLNNNACCC